MLRGLKEAEVSIFQQMQQGLCPLIKPDQSDEGEKVKIMHCC